MGIPNSGVDEIAAKITKRPVVEGKSAVVTRVVFSASGENYTSEGKKVIRYLGPEEKSSGV